MILYNVTTNIDKAVEQDWLRWMKDEHIPSVLATGLPVEGKILRLLTEVENGGATYTAQYFFNAMEDYLTYQKFYAPAMQRQVSERFANQYVSFRTLLEDA